MESEDPPKLSLHEKTLALFEKAKQSKTLREIADESGLPLAWLRKLPTIPQPSVNRIQRLHETLSKKKLSC